VDAETLEHFTALRGAMTSLHGDVAALRTVDRTTQEILRDFHVTAEGLRHEMQILAEGVVMNAEALNRFRAEFIAEIHEIRRGRSR
jgi:hypothetical protein